MVVILLGILGLFDNDLSFRISFSTFLCAIRGSSLTQGTFLDDAIGADPCDDDLKELKLQYRSSDEDVWKGFSPGD